MKKPDPYLSAPIFWLADGTVGTVLQWTEERRRRDPWIAVADRVLAGEFDHKDAHTSILQTLFVGMRKSRHPECLKAVERIKGHRNFSNVREFVFREDPKRRK